MSTAQPAIPEPPYKVGDYAHLGIWGTIVWIDPQDPARHIVQYGEDKQCLLYFRTDQRDLIHRLTAVAEWPPLPEDVWRDRNGARWDAIEIDCSECGNTCKDGNVALRSEFDAYYPGDYLIFKAARNYGPFRLETPGKVRLEREGGQ